MGRVFTHMGKDTIIRDKIRNDNDIIYGARAMNMQLLGQYKRPTSDFDVYTKKPKKKARELEKVLDTRAKGDYYYAKEALHPGTWKVMDKGLDMKKGTEDDFGIADYSKPTRKIKTINRLGIRYAHISERVKDARRSLTKPEFKFRHDKDRKDLERIRLSNKITRWF